MKNRRISLANYIAFLAIMYFVWHFTINAKKHGGYDLTGVSELISNLDKQLTPNIIIYFDAEQALKESLLESLVSQFSKSNLTVSHVDQKLTSQLLASQMYVEISINSNEKFIVKELQQVQIQISDTKSAHVTKNLKRYVNKFFPFIQRQSQLESEQFYSNRLLIFEYYIVNFSGNAQIVEELESMTRKLLGIFGLSQENLRINYKFLPIESFSLEDDILKLSKKGFQDTIKLNQQSHDMNWKEYFSLNILYFNMNQNQKVSYEGEDYQFVFQEPNHFFMQSTSLEERAENLFDTLVALLQIQDQTELMLDGLEFSPDISLLAAYFQKREQVRQYLNYKRELEFMQFISVEGEYKITIESQNEFFRRRDHIKQQLQDFSLKPTDTANIIVDDRFSNLDTFSLEYTLGTYLPIILPFAYPIILGIYDEISAQKK